LNVKLQVFSPVFSTGIFHPTEHKNTEQWHNIYCTMPNRHSEAKLEPWERFNFSIHLIQASMGLSTITREEQLRNVAGLSSLVGNTPLLAINLLYKGEKCTIYAKAEHLNMTGSIKDRMVLHILRRGYERGELAPADTVIEVTSGNTGISFSAIGQALSQRVKIFMPDWMSSERINLIRSLGADITLVSHEQGGFVGSLELANDYAAAIGDAFLPLQFSNADNIDAHYTTTGPEIWWQMKFHGLVPAAFLAGVGTGGTIMGTGRFLREMQPGIRLYPMEPANSPTLSTGHKVGKHRIQGISDEFIPPILDLGELDEIIAVEDGDSIIMAQLLASELGLGVGISSGANLIGAVKVLETLGGDAQVVTIFPDDNKKYLSTDLMTDEPIRDDYLSPHVELLGFRSMKRVCHTCCDPTECFPDGTDIKRDLGMVPACLQRT
jgi:cysteine synthase A